MVEHLMAWKCVYGLLLVKILFQNDCIWGTNIYKNMHLFRDSKDAFYFILLTSMCVLACTPISFRSEYTMDKVYIKMLIYTWFYTVYIKMVFWSAKLSSKMTGWINTSKKESVRRGLISKRQEAKC